MPFTSKVNGLVVELSKLDLGKLDQHHLGYDPDYSPTYIPVPLTKVHVHARVVNFIAQVF